MIEVQAASAPIVSYNSTATEARTKGARMGCLKGKDKNKPKPGRYKCKKCDAVAKKKKDLCKPKKLKKKDCT